MTPKEISYRMRARRLAMQAIYQIEITKQDADTVVTQFHNDEDFDRVDTDYFNLLVRETMTHKDELIERVSSVSDTDFAKLDVVERALLLIGAYEILHNDETDKAVAIDEAVKLARKFGSTGGYKFVNTVLDKV